MSVDAEDGEDPNRGGAGHEYLPDEWEEAELLDWRYMSGQQRDLLLAIGVREAQDDDGIAKRRHVKQMLERFYGRSYGGRDLERIAQVLVVEDLVEKHDLDGEWLGYTLTDTAVAVLHAAHERVENALGVIEG